MGKRCFYEQDPTWDPGWGMPQRYSLFILPAWSNLEKALHSGCRVAKAYCGFETHRGYHAHIAEWNRRCTKDAVPETE